MAGGLEFIREIRIAQFWRRQLGEYEYVSYNPEDLKRWYDALELRGPQEIRDYMNERHSRYPMAQVTGIVGVAPHPPRDIVQLWLESHDKVGTRAYWLSGLAFLVFVYFTATNLQSCTQINPMSRFEMKPPPIGAPLPKQVPPMAPAISSVPQALPVPAANAAKPTGQAQPPH